MTKQTLPAGMSLNNPGNMKQTYGLNYKTKLINGICRYNTLSDGVQSMASLLFDLYALRNCGTLPLLLADYVDHSETDLLRYTQLVCQYAEYNPATVDVLNLKLSDAFEAMRLIRAIIRVEQGNAPASWPLVPNWISIHTMTVAMVRSNRWGVV